MKYLLDTNICIYFLNGRKPKVREHVARHPRRDLAVSSVTVGELYYGVFRSEAVEKNSAAVEAFLADLAVLPFDFAAARAFGEVKGELFRRGLPIGPYDLQIAAVALAADLTLVTHNTQEFRRIPLLRLEDWTG